MGLLKDIGVPGVIIIDLGALLIFGPKRQKKLGQSIGKMLKKKKNVFRIQKSSQSCWRRRKDRE